MIVYIPSCQRFLGFILEQVFISSAEQTILGGTFKEAVFRAVFLGLYLTIYYLIKVLIDLKFLK